MKEIIEQIQKTVGELRAAVDEQKKSNDPLLGEKIDKLNDRIDTLEAQLKEKKGALGGNSNEGDANKAAFKSAFESYVRKGLGEVGPEARKMLSGATDAEGGYTVPEDFRSEVLRKMAEQNVIRSLAHIITTTSDSVAIPTVATEGSAAWTAQSKTAGDGTYTASDVTFGEKVLTPFKLARLTLVSEELLADSAINIDALLADIFAQSFVEGEETAFLKGTGTTQPTGVLNDTGLTALETAVASKMDSDDVINLLYSIKPAYRRGGAFFMNSLIERDVRKYKDQNGQYLWQPAYAANTPNTLLGKPVYNIDGMDDAVADSKQVVLFGDFKYFWIADRAEMTMQRLNERYAELGKVGFIARKRTDGKVADVNAFKVLKVKAAG